VTLFEPTPRIRGPYPSVMHFYSGLPMHFLSGVDIQRARYMTLETMAPLSDDPFVKLPAVAA
jgi:hypothetical protein